jgi:hypothetical protein
VKFENFIRAGSLSRFVRRRKKTGRKIEFSSRVEVRGCDPESVRDRYQASGLNASFSSLIFSSLLSFFSLPSTIPPFQSATCGVV